MTAGDAPSLPDFGDPSHNNKPQGLAALNKGGLLTYVTANYLQLADSRDASEGVAMTENERWYYLERAKTSLEAGRNARDPAIASIHMDLYSRYMALAAQPIEPDPPAVPLRVVARYRH